MLSCSVAIVLSTFTFRDCIYFFFFFSSRRRHTRFDCDWSSDVCSSDLFGRGRLWRLSMPRLAPSYVYGTMHVADARVSQLPEPVDAAFERSRSLMVEFEIGRASCRERV